MQTLPNPIVSTSSQWSTDTTIHRRKTRPVKVGNVTIGGGYPVVVQSMINEDTLDIDGSVAAIRRLHEVGCEIVRVTVPSLAHAHALADIKQKLLQTYQAVPLVADVHHNGMKIALEVAKHVDKVRINPGLYVFEKPKPTRTEYTQAEFDEIGAKIRETLEPLVISLRDQGKAMRIGVNHGSLAERMLFTYGDTPEGMVECDRIPSHLRVPRLPQFGDFAQSLPCARHARCLSTYGTAHG
jgi:(E)-4-hydroxy-3-methylbut-2-enyl-diphosphate synthase